MFSLKALRKNKTAKYGVPMLLDPSLESKVDVEKQTVMLEQEYEKIKELNLESWKNIRGPRPWEDSRELQEQQRSKQNKKD
ncbi:cytochrome c oxidase assembly protein COX16 homolog, mitochondrial isoform X2 [Channa argus]|uniref:cytochrome c oxidase assembly protein COX16 homolog, mitochondrial isoform X2 n=1 Tax=Channa argus TaxID=215402 RepID=UPI00351FB9F4